MLRLNRTQIDSYSDSFPDVLIHRPTPTQTYSYSDLLIVWHTQHTADCQDVPRGAMASAPLRGAARGVVTVPFAAFVRGCLRRCACFLSQHPWLSEQILRMSQAGR
eukprot:8359411-Pyramimonas_sp.AAC.1